MINDIEPLSIVPLFEQYNTQVLIIVDVQESFAKWWDKNGKDSLPERINDFCAEFPTVYQIWDDHRDNKPTWKFYNQVAALKKHYGVDRPDGNIADYSAVFKPEDISSAMDSVKEGSIVEPKLYETIDGNYIIRVVGGTHKWFFVSKEMFDTLSNISCDIVLVGGAEGECMKDIEVLLDLLGKSHRLAEKYCYNAADESDDYYGDEDDEDSLAKPGEAIETDDAGENPGSKEIPLEKQKY